MNAFAKNTQNDDFVAFKRISNLQSGYYSPLLVLLDPLFCLLLFTEKLGDRSQLLPPSRLFSRYKIRGRDVAKLFLLCLTQLHGPDNGIRASLGQLNQIHLKFAGGIRIRQLQWGFNNRVICIVIISSPFRVQWSRHRNDAKRKQMSNDPRSRSRYPSFGFFNVF
ncbi:hypothetical protein D3C78_1178940 [compost metagenome]